jgi:hypothetical protein
VNTLLRPTLAATALLLLLAGGCKRSSQPDDDANHPARLAAQLDADFHKIRTEVESFAVYMTGLYARRDAVLPSIDTSKYTFAPNGAFYKPVDDGGAALWISAVVPITAEMQAVAYFTEPADAELKRICREFPEVSQAYYNDRHSLNRIYPWFDTIAQYPPRMNIPEFNFYYLADTEHNPQRKGVWVAEPYVDPAGRGWMVSTIAPVYIDGVMEGAPGLDVTISTIVDRYFKGHDHPVAVISQEGVLVAATEAAIQVLEMPPLKDHKYLETVKLDLFKPDEYNIRKSTLRPVRAISAALLDEGRTELDLPLLRKHYTVRAARVTELGWTVVEFFEQ